MTEASLDLTLAETLALFLFYLNILPVLLWFKIFQIFIDTYQLINYIYSYVDIIVFVILIR